MKVLHVAAEIFPLVKTGGLADVTGALIPALNASGVDARVLLPGLPAILDGVEQLQIVAEIGPAFGAAKIIIRQGRLPGSGVTAYVVDAPWLYARQGNPYLGPNGHSWPDNPKRFAALSWVAAHLAFGELDPSWAADILHAHDWHAGLAMAYLAEHPAPRVKTVFTVHNLAYQGPFALADRIELGLAASSVTVKGAEFHGQGNFMKAGLALADRITTVSPRYAQEICTPEFGCGMENLLIERRPVLSGILNGVDYKLWDPSTDSHIKKHYTARSLKGKAVCKAALQMQMGLERSSDKPLFCVISRLTDQKGMDLMLRALPKLVQAGGQFALLGSGDRQLEERFNQAAQDMSGQVVVRIGYDEALAHQLIAAADSIIMPSRFEPCGLTQLYGLRYGTVPIVRRVGGLSDTVVDTNAKSVQGNAATGFVFEQANAESLTEVIGRAIDLFHQREQWSSIVKRGMNQDFSWDESSKKYLALYQDLLS